MSSLPHSMARLLNDDAALKRCLGIAVREHRQRRRETQEQLAARAGIHRTYLADVERGSRNLSLSSIARVCTALQVRMPVLFRAVEKAYERTR